MSWTLVSSRFRVHGLVVAIAAVLLLVATSASTAAAGGSKSRPFKGAMENINTVDFSTCVFIPDPFAVHCDVSIEGTITATHLGKGQVSGYVTIDVTEFGQPGGCTELVEGTINFTAADGSRLDMVMTFNQLCEVGGEQVFVGQYDVIGGTGRFVSADGLIDVSGVSFEVLPDGSTRSVNKLSGTVSY